MKREMKKLLYGLSLLLLLGLCAGESMAQNSGAINGRIRWKKSYGKPEALNPCEALSLAAYTEAGRSVGQVIRLGFTETQDDYECSYSIVNLPEGLLIRVAVDSAKGYRWTGGSPAGIFTYRREFRPAGWSGEVTLLRVRADLPSRARGDF